FIEHRHKQAAGNYAWVLRDGLSADTTQHCYGLAFVLLAQAHALRIGVSEARAQLDTTFALMERLFWREQDGLYADEATADGVVAPYRGQNANMHTCEALIAAFEATGAPHFLHRAERLAHNIAQRQAAHANGWIWEHYNADWTPDWQYNLNDPANMFRPWGFQPGHMTEWAKLLLLLERHAPHLQGDSAWLLPRAEALFNAAVGYAWDHTHGGFVYGVAPDMSVCDSDKYFWVQAETLATAALLGQRTGDVRYWDWYDKTWRYSWDHMIDHQYGGWHRILRNDNHRYGLARPPHGKTDFYHPMGAILESLTANGAAVA
ncbi:MAG TPA: AGE family epimerase/isomerase, partial [Burkholderiaceae bacterium]